MKRLALLLTIATAVTAAAQVMTPIAGDPVRIDSGRVSGSVTGGIKTYLGVPFAAPPLRENRWREPQPVKAWDGILTATRQPAECVQSLRSSSQNHYFGDELAGEDCLYLNIWEPATAKVSMIPQNYVKLEGKAAQQMVKLMDVLDDHDDVRQVWSNFDIEEKEIEASLA